jgi:hypothetical protein
MLCHYLNVMGRPIALRVAGLRAGMRIFEKLLAVMNTHRTSCYDVHRSVDIRAGGPGASAPGVWIMPIKINNGIKWYRVRSTQLELEISTEISAEKAGILDLRTSAYSEYPQGYWPRCGWFGCRGNLR